MSLCRFSDDDWQSDVYAYEDADGGYTVHVAARRLTRRPPPLDRAAYQRWLETGDDTAFEAWYASLQRQLAAVATIPTRPISLPHAGESFHVQTPQDLLALLKRLRALGYRVPARALAHEQATKGSLGRIAEE